MSLQAAKRLIKGIPFITRSPKNDRLYHFNAQGKRISAKMYAILSRKDPATGRFLSNKALAKRGSLKAQEERLVQEFKGPPKGGTLWVKIVGKYPDRFAAFL